MEYPLNQNDKSIIEQTQFAQIIARILKGGLPIYTKARTGQKQGEVYLTDISGTRKICAYISGVEYCATLT